MVVADEQQGQRVTVVLLVLGRHRLPATSSALVIMAGHQEHGVRALLLLLLLLQRQGRALLHHHN